MQQASPKAKNKKIKDRISLYKTLAHGASLVAQWKGILLPTQET